MGFLNVLAVEGPGPPPRAPEAPRAGVEGVGSYSKPSLDPLGFGLSGITIVAFGSGYQIEVKY